MRWQQRGMGAVLVTLVAVGAVALPACGSSGASGRAARAPVTVLAAASLTEAFQDLQPDLARGPGALEVAYSFAGSGALVAQVEQGVPADVIATADTTSMAKLVDAGLVEAPATFARNRLQILVAPGNPHAVHGLADLARQDLTVVVADESVPAGRYAAQALAKAGVTIDPASKELDVKAAVTKVTSGEADATIAYATDVLAAGPRAAGVDIPDDQNVIADYPIAVVKGAPHRDAALAFVAAVTGDAGRRALLGRGFLAAR